MMKKTILTTVLAAGLAGPVAASTFLDFTSSGIGTGNLTGTVGTVGYTISGFGGALTDATHKTNLGCNVGYTFACDAVGGSYDVGFGISGGNPKEIDGINGQEYVQVTFDKVVNILGFAGMLTYNDSQNTGGTEQTALYYSSDGGSTFNSVVGVTQNNDADPGVVNDSFGTVGLSYLSGLSLKADVVRFFAVGTSPFDDGNANVTAAALEVSAVPVPASLPLMLVGIGALGWARRRKNRAA